jgi:hypothetical protein
VFISPKGDERQLWWVFWVRGSGAPGNAWGAGSFSGERGRRPSVHILTAVGVGAVYVSDAEAVGDPS